MRIVRRDMESKWKTCSLSPLLTTSRGVTRPCIIFSGCLLVAIVYGAFRFIDVLPRKPKILLSEPAASPVVAQRNAGSPTGAATTSLSAETPLEQPIPPIPAVTNLRVPPQGEGPASFRVKFTTTKGAFTVLVTRAWSPRGADRFYNLVQSGFYSDVPFFRVIEGFMAQFGLHGDPRITEKWQKYPIPDDPARESNRRGKVTFATAGPNTRSCQLFVNFGDNHFLDPQGFTPFGEVEGDGMERVLDHIHVTGEGAPDGPGPAQHELSTRGSGWLRETFPSISYITHAEIVTDGAQDPTVKSSVLLSRDKPATASTQGNLGGPGVVTMARDGDWLKDRWAAQADMNGSPMVLPQWLTVDLGQAYVVTKAEIDWETAFARQYEIKVSKVASSGYNTIFTENDGAGKETRPQHVLHNCAIPGTTVRGRFVRLVLLQSGTQYGISVWRFDIFGYL